MSELKPCPFCGWTDVHVTDCQTYVFCNDCDVCGPDADAHMTAAQAWNTRADSLALAAAVQAEREVCARTIGDLRTADTVTARAVVINGMRAIRSRGPAPAVDVLGVVREYVEAFDEYLDAHQTGMTITDEKRERIVKAFDRKAKAGVALRSLVPGAAANDKGDKP